MEQEAEGMAMSLKGLDKKVGDAGLRLGAHAAHLELADGETVRISRAEEVERIEIIGLLGGAAMVVGDGKRKLRFHLDGAQRTAVEEWIGPPTRGHLRQALRRRYAWGIPIGLLFILGSIPLAADAVAGIEAAPFDPVNAILGGGLLMLWGLSKLWPRPQLFLFDSAWFCMLAGDTLFDILTGRSSWWWLFFAAIIMLFVQTGIRLYGRFQGVMDREADGAR